MRIAGDITIYPDVGTRRAIARAGIRTVIGAFTLCLDETGRVVGLHRRDVHLQPVARRGSK